MSANLPPTLPTGSSGSTRPSTSIGRAQNLNTTKLNQYKDRENAKTSIGHVGKEASGAPSTSAAHPGGVRQAARTSINSAARQIDPNDDGYDQEAADRRRYAHIREMMAEKKQREADEAAAAAVEKGVKVMKGKSFKSSGFGGLHKNLKSFIKKNRSSYKNLSASDKKILEGVIGDAAKRKSTGSGFTYKDRRAMGKQAKKHWKSGNISKTDYKSFKKIVGGLE